MLRVLIGVGICTWEGICVCERPSIGTHLGRNHGHALCKGELLVEQTYSGDVCTDDVFKTLQFPHDKSPVGPRLLNESTIWKGTATSSDAYACIGDIKMVATYTDIYMRRKTVIRVANLSLGGICLLVRWCL